MITFISLFVLSICHLGLAQGQNGTEVPSNCMPYELYDNDLKQCVRDCTNVANSQFTFDLSNVDQCVCSTDFTWEVTSALCARICSGVENSNGQVVTSDVSKCQCLGGWAWNPSSNDCSTSLCQSNKIWIDSVSACGRNCINVQNSKHVVNLLDSNFDECVCNYGYVWNPSAEECQIDCSIMTSSQQCQVSCSEGCSICSSSGCEACAPSFALLSNRTCIKCVRGCTGTCDANNIGSCLGCANGYYSVNLVCQKCPTGCSECSSATLCSNCFNGFGLASYNNGSTLCAKKCKFPCLTCNESNNCLTCSSGYYLQNNQCSVNETCDINTCSSCPSGTFGNPGSCAACSTSCKTCTSSSSCTQCAGGYYLNGNSCPACPTQCKTCSNTQHCTLCSDGYVATTNTNDGLTCVACSSNCLTCVQTPSQCDTCKEGYRNLNRRCYKRYNTGFQFKLNTNYNSFILGKNYHIFMGKVAKFFNKNADNIIINSLRQGSVIIDGSVEVDNETQAFEQANLLAAAVANDPNLFEIPIIESKTGAFLDDTPLVKTAGSSLTNQQVSVAAVVLGTVIPVVVVAIIASIILWMRKKKESSSEEGMGEYEKNYDPVIYNETEPGLIRNGHII